MLRVNKIVGFIESAVLHYFVIKWYW